MLGKERKSKKENNVQLDQNTDVQNKGSVTAPWWRTVLPHAADFWDLLTATIIVPWPVKCEPLALLS